MYTRYREEWVVRIDGNEAFGVGRCRDDNGNTIYRTTADRFAAVVREHVDGADPED